MAELKFKTMGVNDEDPTKVIVNIGKEDHHDFIYVNAKIGERIQPHQKDGVQFMWRELTAEHDEDKLQGCLLAHTMGLGKTMQGRCFPMLCGDSLLFGEPPDMFRDSFSRYMATVQRLSESGNADSESIGSYYSFSNHCRSGKVVEQQSLNSGSSHPQEVTNTSSLPTGAVG